MVPTLQCGLLRSNFCLAMGLLFLFLSAFRKARGPPWAISNGAAFLIRNDRPVNRSDRATFQSWPSAKADLSIGRGGSRLPRPHYFAGGLVSGFLSPAAFCAACNCSTLVCRLVTTLLSEATSLLSATISVLAAFSLCRASSAFLVTNCCRKLTLLCKQPVRLSSPALLVQSSMPAISWAGATAQPATTSPKAKAARVIILNPTVGIIVFSAVGFVPPTCNRCDQRSPIARARTAMPDRCTGIIRFPSLGLFGQNANRPARC